MRGVFLSGLSLLYSILGFGSESESIKLGAIILVAAAFIVLAIDDLGNKK